MPYVLARRLRWLLAIAALAALSFLPPLARPGAAHDIPDHIELRGFVKPEGDRLVFLVRIPLALLEGLALPKRGPGYLDLARIDEALDRSVLAATRQFVLYEDGARLAHDGARARISQPSEDSFGTFAEARAHVLGPPLPEASNVFWNQGYFDVGLEYPIRSDRSSFALEMLVGFGLAGRLTLSLQFLPPDGEPRVYEIHGGHGWLELDPGRLHVAWTFAGLGFWHMLEGIDHLLFLLCLVLPLRLRRDALAAALAAFAAGYSLALIAWSTGGAEAGNWFRLAVQFMIAASIFYLAVENVLAGRLAAGWRWMVAGLSGLVFGVAFGIALDERLQFAGAHRPTALLSFDVGLALGGAAVVAAALVGLGLLSRHPRLARRGALVVSVLVAHESWHWMVERFQTLRLTRPPMVDAAALYDAALWAATLAFAGIALWVLVLGPALRRGRQRHSESEVGSPP